jgi:opacity protein-like surface antigen
MKMIEKFSAWLMMAVLLCTVTAEAQLARQTTKVGTTVAPFLKIGAGAKSIAMGGGAVAVPGDVYAMYWNPGALTTVPGMGEATFTHAQWLADVKYDFAAAAINLDGVGTMAFSLTSLTVPEDIVRTEVNPEGDGRKWNAGSFALGVGFSRALTDRFSIGGAFKYIRDAIWNESAQGFAIDVGTYYVTPFNDLRIGASISNFGTKMRLDGHDLSFNNNPGGKSGQEAQNVPSLYETEAYDLPLSFRIGLSMDAVKTEKIRATIAIDATHPNDNVEYLNSGLELGYDEMVFGRVGYKSLFMNDAEGHFTWGVGINLGLSSTASIKLDYAFADYGRLKNVQYMTLSVVY